MLSTSSLRTLSAGMGKALFPPGFRFHPTDIELIKYYLKRKVMRKRVMFEFISEVDIYRFSPWDLPDKSAFRSKDLEWFFYCPTEKKYVNGGKMNRATESGYWKTTGRDRPVTDNGEAVGMIKTLIFHEGRPPRGKRTDWVMHEYRLEDKNLAESGVAQDPYVICKIFQKSGLGPRNGAQYGAPFNEEEWDEDETDAFENLFPSAGLPVSNSQLGGNHFDPAPTGISSLTSGNISVGSSFGLASSTAVPSPVEMQTTAKDDFLPDSVSQSVPDDVSLLLEMFTHNENVLPSEKNNMENSDAFYYHSTWEGASSLDCDDIFNELANLEKPASFIDDGFDICTGSYLELNDLDSPLFYSHAPENVTTCGPPSQYTFEHYHENPVHLVSEDAARQHPSDQSLCVSHMPFNGNCDVYNFQQESCNVPGHGHHQAALFDVDAFRQFENQGNNSTK